MNIRAKVYGGGESAAVEPVLKPKKAKGAKPIGLDSLKVAREESRTTNSRGDDRHRLNEQTVRMTKGRRSFEVQLINVSGGGAMVRGDFKGKLWDEVQLHLGENGTIDCAVRWIRDDRVGLEFAHETKIDCGADQQAEILREVVRQSFPDFAAKTPAVETAVIPNDGPDARAASRHPLVWSGLLHHDYQSTPVRVRNISSSGAMVDCPAPLRVGSEPLLELSDSISVSATVTWVTGDQAGLRFHSPFDLYDLARSKPQVMPLEWQPPSYLDLDYSAAAPWPTQSLAELREELEGFLKR